MDSPNFYKQVAATTRKHLSPAAERFVARQIRNHLKKDPQTLQPKDLAQLIDWIELSMRTIYSKQHTVDLYMNELRALIALSTKKPLYHDKKN